MEQVALCACDDYEQSKVDFAVSKAVDLLGGINKFVKEGQTVVIKANMLMKCGPDKCATTHPSVVEAIGKLVKQAGASKVIIADSAGGPFTEGYMNGIYKASGLKEIADKNGFEMNDNFNSFEVSLSNGKVAKRFLICDCLEKADVIINVSKLKTHSFTGFTNAVKNMFGAIPGLTKVEMHGQFKTLDVFGDFFYTFRFLCGKAFILRIFCHNFERIPRRSLPDTYLRCKHRQRGCHGMFLFIYAHKHAFANGPYGIAARSGERPLAKKQRE